MLETWGEDNAWREIQLLLVNCRGRILDIACGTGKVMELLSQFPQLEVHGCDISDFLLSKAIARGLDRTRLRVCDATDTKYEEKSFDYSYSIGSLEHFTEDGIAAFLTEAARITKYSSCHQIPVSPKRDEGWITPSQSYFNNTVDWWLPKFRAVFSDVQVLRSNWADGDRSVGQWFICGNKTTKGLQPNQ
ncbi:MAG: hypothetical protein QOE77_2681 [Blastocatellia bacterium]|nr:hypothetical protein [Blastocatellia bacterium]